MLAHVLSREETPECHRVSTHGASWLSGIINFLRCRAVSSNILVLSSLLEARCCALYGAAAAYESTRGLTALASSAVADKLGLSPAAGNELLK